MKAKNILDFEAIVFPENGLGYAAAFEFNGLFKVDVKTQKCEFITLFPNEDIGEKRIYGSALYHDSNIYFIPMAGKYISIYNIETNEINQVTIPIPLVKYSFYKWKQKFGQAVYYNEYIFLFPFTYPGILKLDIKNNKVTVINNWIPTEGYFFRGGMCVDGLHVYLPSGTNNIILEFNIETEQAIIHRIGKYNNGTMCIRKYKNGYWIAPRIKGSVIYWNPNTGEVNEIIDYPKGFSAQKIVFSEIVCCGGQLFFMPASANRVLTVDENTRQLVIIDKWKPRENAMTVCMFETGDYYYFREAINSTKLYKRFRIQKSDGKTETYAFTVENDDEFKKNYYDTSIRLGEIMKENENFKLEDFLNLIR